MNSNDLFELYVYQKLAKEGHRPSQNVIKTYNPDKGFVTNPDAYRLYTPIRTIMRAKYNLNHPESELAYKSHYTDEQLSELKSYVDMLFPDTGEKP